MAKKLFYVSPLRTFRKRNVAEIYFTPLIFPPAAVQRKKIRVRGSKLKAKRNLWESDFHLIFITQLSLSVDVSRIFMAAQSFKFEFMIQLNLRKFNFTHLESFRIELNPPAGWVKCLLNRPLENAVERKILLRCWAPQHILWSTAHSATPRV